jgi:hypothetical protein
VPAKRASSTSCPGRGLRPAPIDATAFPHRRERFLLKHTVSLRPHASQEQTQAATVAGSIMECHPSIRIGRGLRELPRPGALRPSAY